MTMPPPLFAASTPVDWQQWVLIAGGFGLLGYFYLRSRGGRRRDPLSRPPREIAGAVDLARHRATERQLEGLLVDLEQMSRQISAQLDTRAARLEALLNEADEKLAALDRANQLPLAASPRERDPFSISKPQAAVERPASANPTEPSNLSPPPDGVDRTTARIYALSDEGRPTGQIAMEINRPQGEVELILALRPR